MRKLLLLLALAPVIAAASGLGNLHSIGDSLTDGAGCSPGEGGYRHQLHRDLQASNIPHTLVGTLGTWPGGLWPEGLHDGHGGWSTQDLIDGRSGQGNIVDWLNQCQSDTIILTIGRNDPWDWSYSYSRYSQLVTLIYSVRPQARIYWCSVFLPLDQSFWEDYHCLTQNAAIKQVITDQRAFGRQIYYVDSYTWLKGRFDIFADGVHLNDVGYRLWEQLLFMRIRKTPLISDSPQKKDPIIVGIHREAA